MFQNWWYSCVFMTWNHDPQWVPCDGWAISRSERSILFYTLPGYTHIEHGDSDRFNRGMVHSAMDQIHAFTRRCTNDGTDDPKVVVGCRRGDSVARGECWTESAWVVFLMFRNPFDLICGFGWVSDDHVPCPFGLLMADVGMSNMDPDEINDQPAKNVDKWRDITQPKLWICNDFARKLSCIRLMRKKSLMTRSSPMFSHGLYLLNYPMFPLQGRPPKRWHR